MLLIGSAIAATVEYTLNGINGGGVWWYNTNLDDPAWGNKLETVHAVVTVNILDDDENVACHFSLSIGRSFSGEFIWPENGNQIDAVKYSGSASAWACGNWEGRGNAWVQMPGKARAHDENPNGGIDIGGEGEPYGVYASDSCLRDSFFLGRSASVGASCWQGGVSAQIGIDVSGF